MKKPTEKSLLLSLKLSLILFVIRLSPEKLRANAECKLSSYNLYQGNGLYQCKYAHFNHRILLNSWFFDLSQLMPPIKMLALDLDGTLAVDNNQVLPATRSALQKLHETGVEVVIVTGRRYRTTKFVMKSLGFDVYAVCNGGALVKTPNAETHHETTYSLSQLADVVSVARESKLALIGQRDADDRGGPDFIIDNAIPWSDVIHGYFDSNKAWGIKGDIRAQAPEFLVTATFGDEQQLKMLCSDIHRSFPQTFETITVPQLGTDNWYCEISLANITKWHGLSKLASLFGIGPANICAVGDQLNDLPMLKEVGHGVAMGNGDEALHAHAKFVCGNHDEDGILDVVEYIHKHNKQIAQ
jgi:hypothetical protein|tara:strand:- start:13171 stop:14238 length:1068 start_codon:yes stop_codon:yes gene_type:complete